MFVLVLSILAQVMRLALIKDLAETLEQSARETDSETTTESEQEERSAPVAGMSASAV